MFTGSIGVGVKTYLFLLVCICVFHVGNGDGTSDVHVTECRRPVCRLGVSNDISEISDFIGAGATNLVEGSLVLFEGSWNYRRFGKRLRLTETILRRLRKAMLNLRSLDSNQYTVGAISTQLSWGGYGFLTAERIVPSSGRIYRSDLSCLVYSNDVCRMEVFRGDEVVGSDRVFLRCEGISDLTQEIIAEHAKQEKNEGIESKEGNQRSPDTNGKDDSTAGIQAESKDGKERKE